jgi:hypothetical protein
MTLPFGRLVGKTLATSLFGSQKGSDKRLVIVYAQFELFHAGADFRWEKLPSTPAQV